MQHSSLLTLVLLLAVSQANIFPMVEETTTIQTLPEEGHDCTIYILKIIADVNQIAEQIEQQKWDHIMPLAVDLGENVMRAYQCFHQSSLPQMIESVTKTVHHHCPYIECVKKHLIEAHCVGVKFVRLLVLGKPECARKLIPKISKHLEEATHCKKKR